MVSSKNGSLSSLPWFHWFSSNWTTDALKTAIQFAMWWSTESVFWHFFLYQTVFTHFHFFCNFGLKFQVEGAMPLLKKNNPADYFTHTFLPKKRKERRKEERMDLTLIIKVIYIEKLISTKCNKTVSKTMYP